MDRRTFLKSAVGAGALATAGGFATPAISQRAAAQALRLVPHADLANFDPVWSNAYIARNAGLFVCAMLSGLATTLCPPPGRPGSRRAGGDVPWWKRKGGGAQRRFSKNSGATRPVRSRHHGWRGGNGFCSIASNGS